MELPAHGKRRVSVLLMAAPQRAQVLVVQGAEGRWHVPDTHSHWRIGRRMPEPQSAAAVMLHDITLGILGEVTDIKRQLSAHGTRARLPTGGFVYKCHADALGCMDLRATLAVYNRVRKHMAASAMAADAEPLPRIELHDVADVCSAASHSKYGAGTIEAVRSTIAVPDPPAAVAAGADAPAAE